MPVPLRYRLTALTGLMLAQFLAPIARAQEPAPAASEKPALFKEQLVIPAGTPEETLEYFQRLKEQRPKFEDPDQAKAHFQRVYETIAAGSGKLLAGKLTADQEAKVTAARFEALVILNRLQDERAAAPMLAMAEKLKAHKDRELADYARLQLLQLHMDGAMGGSGAAANKLME